jgi:hypothetical protein
MSTPRHAPWVLGNPMPELTLSPIHELRIWPLFFPFKKLFEEPVFPSKLSNTGNGKSYSFVFI